MYRPHGGNNQNWELRFKKRGFFLIVSEKSKKCLDAPHRNVLHQWDCHGMKHQQFRFAPLSGSSRKRPSSGTRPSSKPSSSGRKKSSDKKSSKKIKFAGHHHIKNAQGLCLADSGYNKKFRFSPCNEKDDNLFFKLEKQRDGRFVIISDLGNALERRKRRIVARRITYKSAQRWKIREVDGSFVIRTSRRRCFTSEDSARLRPCQNKPNQVFKFSPYDKVYVSKK
jgi:hypothetical protein